MQSRTKIAFLILLLGWLVADSALGQQSSTNTEDANQLQTDEENIEGRPTLVLEAPQRQALDIEFPALSKKELEITRAPQSGSGPLQVGFHRPVPLDMRGDLSDRLVWQVLDSNKVAYLKVSSPRAKTLRLELDIRLPLGASMRFFHVNEQGETQIGEEFTREKIEQLDEKTLWTSVVAGNQLSIEFQLPKHLDIDEVTIELKNLSHGYISNLFKTTTNDKECTNHIPVACAIDDGDTTQTTADSVLRIITEGGGVSSLCSAALITDTAQSQSYLLTAAHCISTEAEASTVSPRWFYQTSACRSDTIDSRETTSLVGGDLVAARFSEDMSLVLLKSQPPPNARYASWDSANTVASGTSLFGIHHPGGRAKSFWKGRSTGNLNVNVCDSDGNDCFLVEDAFDVTFNSGTIEPGSSGAPVFLSATNTIVGVTSAQDGECDDRSGFFGKFSNFYPLVEDTLDPDEDLVLDDHGDAPGSASLVTLGRTVSGQIGQKGDVDFFVLSLSSATRVSFHTTGSLDTLGQLQNADGDVLATDDDSGTGQNFLIEEDLNVGKFYLRVSSAGGTTGSYVLHIESPKSDNGMGGDDSDDDHGDTQDKATFVQVGSETTGTIDPINDVDFFRVDLPEPGLLTVYTTGSTDTFGRLSSADGTINFQDDDDGFNYNFHISMDVHVDTYFIEVSGYQDTTGKYLLHVEFKPWVLDLETIRLAASVLVVEEHDRSSVAITVIADEPLRKDEIVELDLSGTATHKVDYEISHTALTIKKGESEGMTTLTPYRDWINEEDETVELMVASTSTESGAGGAFLTVTIQDIFDEDGTVFQTKMGPDLVPLVELQAGQETITVVATTYNVGSKESIESSLVLSLHESPEFDQSEELPRWDITVPRLDSHNASYQYRFDINLAELLSDSVYFGRIRIEYSTKDTELDAENNTVHFGFALDAEKQLKVQCNAPVRISHSASPDPLRQYQWNIRNTGSFTLTDTYLTEGVDLNMTRTLEAAYTGKGTVIAVVDTGMEICHPDLRANVDTKGSINFRAITGSGNSSYSTSNSDPFNPTTTGDHGTSVAGIIAAIENNGVGGRGIAPKSRIRAFNFLQNQTLPNLIDSLTESSTMDSADVVNLGFGNLFRTSSDNDLTAILGRGTEFGREERGTLFIKAAGNSFSQCNTLQHPIHPEIGCWSSNSDAVNNIPFALVVGAFSANGKHADYSSSGSNLWLSAPSGTIGENSIGLIATDQFGQERGYGTVIQDALWHENTVNFDRDYLSTFGGTGGAAAQVSGVVAILLEIQPKLTSRDIKHILATTAQEVDPDNPPIRVVIGDALYVLRHGWSTNHAGYAFHNLFGFGAIDVDAAVEMANEWDPDSLGMYAASKWLESDHKRSKPIQIPDQDVTGAVDILTVDQSTTYETCAEYQLDDHCIPDDSNALNVVTDSYGQLLTGPRVQVEAVVLRLKVSHTRLSDLGIHLTSPRGTESIVNTVLNNAYAYDSDGNEYLYFLTNAFYGEDPLGDWKLKVVDVIEGETGQFHSWWLRFYVGEHPVE